MKKVISVILAVVLVFSLGATVFAATPNFLGSFVEDYVGSPTNTGGLRLIRFEHSTEDCNGVIKLVPFAERNKYDEAAKLAFDNAYNSVANAKDLGSIIGGLSNVAKSKGVSVNNLAISDLFEHVCIGCEEHAKHGYTTVEVAPELIKNYVALVCYVDGEWKIVEDVTVGANSLTYDIQTNAPYAIVVSRDGISKMGESNTIYIWIALLAVSVVGLGAVAVVYSKKKKNEN